MHPMKSKCSDHRKVGRARYKAEGGSVPFYTEADKERLSPLWYPRTPNLSALSAASPDDQARVKSIRSDNYDTNALVRAYSPKD